jgi:hypothetical protein
MAVVQISKIQQRRGQKLLNGMPQLSAAELAWAVDTQELFIGNGSVAEGSPYVGNTRILTEHDNLLELAGSYKFAESDASITASVFRSIQSKLDEIEVSIIDFGPEPDVSTNHTPYLEAALTELFRNSDTKFRKKLKIPNGHYYFNTVLKIPSNVIIEGETRQGVILDVGTTGIEFVTAVGTDRLNFTSTDHPDNVLISNLTINYINGETDITGLRHSVFKDVTWTSNYVLGDNVSTAVPASQSYDLSVVSTTGNINITGIGVTSGSLTQVFLPSGVSATIDSLVASLQGDATFNANFEAERVAASLIITALPESGLTASEIENYFLIRVTPTNITPQFDVEPTPTQSSSGINNTSAALSWENATYGTRTTEIEFIGCSFESTALPLKCIHTHRESDNFDTELEFKDCMFFVCDTGVYLEGVADRQVNAWQFNDCVFEEIAKQAVFINYGTGTVIKNSKFKNVGNNTFGAAYPSTEMVRFGTKYGNVVENCQSDRHQAGGITLLDTTVGVPEVINSGNVTFTNDYYSTIYLSDTFTPLAVFSTQQRFIIIDYTLTLGEYNYNRKGVLTITLNDGIQDAGDHVAITDNFTYSTSLVSDPGGNVITNFEFNAELKDNTNLNDSTNPPGDQIRVDTVLLTYRNLLQFNSTGTISYTVRYGV